MITVITQEVFCSRQPTDVAISSKEKVVWICKKNAEHIWEASVASRAVRGTGCPYCSGHKKAPDNSLAAKRPAVSKLWHPTRNLPLTAWDVTPGEAREVYWRCPRSATHVWKALIHNVVISHDKHGTSGCPFCAGKKVDERNNFATRYPEAAKNWHSKRNLPLRPTDVTPYSEKIVWWECEKSKRHAFQKSVGEVVKAWVRHKSSGCGACHGQKASVENCLKTLCFEVAALWHPIRNAPLLPSQVKPASKKVAWWLCPNGPNHEWSETIAWLTSRQKKGIIPCPFCAGRSATHGNNLWDKCPEVARYWDPERNLPIRPWEVMPGSSKRYFWRCPTDANHRWDAQVGNMVKLSKDKKIPCRVCRKNGRAADASGQKD